MRVVTYGGGIVFVRDAVRAVTIGAMVVMLMTQALAAPALACYAAGPPFHPQSERTPYNFVDFLIGQDTGTAITRGIHGGISFASGTPDPDPFNSTRRNKIGVMLQAKQVSPVNGRDTWSGVGWEMGYLLTLPSPSRDVWSHAPTVFFEGIDNVSDYRDVFGAAEALGEYEVSWAGGIGSRWKYNSWYKRSGAWYIAGYAELDAEYTIATAQGEASDVDGEARCLALSASNAAFHELGSPVALQLLTDTWRGWTSAFPRSLFPDNSRPYVVVDWTWDHFGVGGLGNR